MRKIKPFLYQQLAVFKKSQHLKFIKKLKPKRKRRNLLIFLITQMKANSKKLKD